jgi:hypothetical protein
MRRSSLAWIVVALLCSGCTAKSVPVSVSQCNVKPGASVTRLTARVTNQGRKPIREVKVSLDFYRNYRFVRTVALARFSPVLDPGSTRTVTALVDGTTMSGTPMRCIATRVTYGDGTIQRDATNLP